MRRIIIVFCMMLALSGCSGFMGKSNITNLLSAPKLSQTESEIVKAIDNHIGENITIKYSTPHGYTSPVQLIDIDGDGTDEAVVFYYAPNKGANIRIAMLSVKDGEWNIVFDKEGLGSDVFYFGVEEFINLSTKQILVGYLTTNMDQNFFVTYFTDPAANIDDYIESCQDVIVGDINGDKYSEVILTDNTSDSKVRLRSLEWSEEYDFKVVGTRKLKVYNAEITQLLFGESADGETVLYVDYRDDYNQMHTEGILFRDGGKMYDAFETAAFALEEYELSDIVESPAGYHIILRLPTTRNSVIDYDYTTDDYYTVLAYAATDVYSKRLTKWMSECDVKWTADFESITAEQIFA